MDPIAAPRTMGNLQKYIVSWGGKILESNLQIAVANIMLHPNPDLVSQEVSQICNVRHIGTKMMQSFIFPPEIVHEMDAADHRANREITPSALYTSIKAVITLMNGLNGIIEAGAMYGVSVASVCVTIINMNPMSNTSVLDPPPSSSTKATVPTAEPVNPPT